MAYVSPETLQSLLARALLDYPPEERETLRHDLEGTLSQFFTAIQGLPGLSPESSPKDLGPDLTHPTLPWRSPLPYENLNSQDALNAAAQNEEPYFVCYPSWEDA